MRLKRKRELHPSKEEVVMLGYYTDEQPNYELTSESTAMALLILYPLMKPVDINRKKTLLKLYRAHSGYQELYNQVEKIAKQGQDIFSSSNTALAASMADILKIDANKDRLKLKDTAPVEITSSGGTVTLKNNTAFSYSVGVYAKEGDKPVDKSLNLAGSTLNESVILKQIVWWLQGPDEVNTTGTIDLKTIGLQPGEYEIRLRSGLAFDESIENMQAAKQNVNEWLSVILGNLSVTEFVENE